MVSFCEAVYDGEAFVEGVLCRRIEKLSQCDECGQQEKSSLVDAKGECLKSWRPQALVDAILAKKIWELRGDGGNHHWSGSGFCAGYDVDYVVETKRGHNLAVPLRKAVQLPIREFPELWAVLARSASSMHLVQASLQVQPKLRILWSRDRKLRTSEIPGCALPLTGVLRG